MEFQNEMMDEKDCKIIEAIRYDARKSYEQIGQETGMSRVAVKNRMDAMKEKGIIKHYETVLDKVKAENAQQFILDIETNPENLVYVKNYLGMSRFIHQLYMVSGSCHMLAFGSAPNSAILQVYVNRLTRELSKKVRKISLQTVLSVCKDVDGGIEYYEETEISDVCESNDDGDGH